jgi:hypothetical protein
MSEKEQEKQTSLMEKTVKAMREQNKILEQQQRDAEETKEKQKEYNELLEAAYKEDFARRGMFEKMNMTLKKMFDFQVLARKEDKRDIAGAKETVAEERQPVKVDTVEVDGLEGIFGAILGAVAGFVVGFVAEVTRVYKAMVISLKNIPQLAVRLFETIKGAFTFLEEVFVIIGRETGITAKFTKMMNGIRGLAAEGTLLGDIIQLAKAEAKVVGGAFKGIFIGIIDFGKAIVNGILKPFRAVGSFIRELKVAEQFAVELELLAAGFRKIINIPKTIATQVTSVVAKTEQIIAPIVGTLERAFGFGDVQKALRAMEEGAATTSRVLGTAGETATGVAKTTGRMAEIFGEFRVLITNAFNGVKAITAGIGKAKGPLKLVFEAVEGFVSAFKTVFSAIKPLGELVGKLFVPIIVVYETITNFFKAFTQEGAEAKSFGEKLLEATIGTLTGIIEELVTVPLDLVKDIISWAAGKMGFDSFAETLDSFSFTEFFDEFVDDLVFTFTKMFDFLGDQITSLMDDPLQYAKDILAVAADGIKNMIKGIGGMLKKAIIKVVNLIPGVNIPTESEEEMQDRLDAEKQKEVQKAFEDKGIVERKGLGKRFGGGEASVEQEQLEQLSNKQLSELGRAYQDNDKILSQVEMEMERRKVMLAKQKAEADAQEDFLTSFPTANQPEKVNEATMQQAIRPEPVTPVVVVEDPTPTVSSPQVQGGSQSQSELLDELKMREDQLAQTKAQSQGSGMGPIMNAPTTVTNNNSVTNKSFYQDQPSSRDDTDMLYIYRATGSSR